MYDHIKFADGVLPDGITDPGDFQTKNLDCYLLDYHVNKKGQLQVTKHENHTGEIRFGNNNYDFVAWCEEGVIKKIVRLK